MNTTKENQSRNVFELVHGAPPFSSQEILKALNLWEDYPQHFCCFVEFCSGPARTAADIRLRARNLDGNRIEIPLIYKNIADVDVSVKFMQESQPRQLVQFIGTIPPEYHDLIINRKSRYGRFDFVSGEGASQRSDLVIGEIKSHECRVEINRFTMPFIHEALTKIIAKELDRRGINSRNFRRSAEVCRGVSALHQEFLSSTSAHWADGLNIVQFAKKFPGDVESVTLATVDCSAFRSQLELDCEQVPSNTMTRRRGRMKLDDSRGKNVVFEATLREHPSLMDDIDKLATLTGISPSTARRWLADLLERDDARRQLQYDRTHGRTNDIPD